MSEIKSTLIEQMRLRIAKRKLAKVEKSEIEETTEEREARIMEDETAWDTSSITHQGILPR